MSNMWSRLDLNFKDTDITCQMQQFLLRIAADVFFLSFLDEGSSEALLFRHPDLSHQNTPASAVDLYFMHNY